MDKHDFFKARRNKTILFAEGIGSMECYAPFPLYSGCGEGFDGVGEGTCENRRAQVRWMREGVYGDK